MENGRVKTFKRIGEISYEALKRLVPLVSALVVAVAMLLTFSANGLYPYGTKTLSWCDMDQQVVPLLLDLKDVLAGKEGFFFSFKNAGGMNFYGVFFFFLASPFSFLVAFVDKADVSSFANILVLLKMCVMAATASLYFMHRRKDAPLLTVALSVLYAFSGYTMLYYQNVVWLDMAYLFPLLMLGLDRLREGKRTLFIAVLTTCMFVNYYIGYMLVIFLLLYAFVWLLLKKDKRFAGNFLLSCAVAALLSAVVWLPCFWQYFSSGRKTSVLQNLVNSQPMTTYATAIPTIFSVLFLFPFALWRRDKEKEDGRLLLILFLATLAPVFFEPINKMWQTGSYMAFPTRYSFITIFLCETCAFDSMSVKKKGKEIIKNRLPVYALNVFLVLLATGYAVFAVRYTLVNKEVMDAYSQTLWGDDESFKALALLYAIALLVGITWFVFHKLRIFKPVFLWLGVAILIGSELYVAPVIYMLTPAHETADYQSVVELADKIDDEGFYRVKAESEYSWADFDANTMGGLGYNALGHYTSLTSADYMMTIKRMGYTSYWMEVGNSGGTVLSDALLSVKYSITTGKSADTVYAGEKYSIGKTFAYLPLGIVAANDIVKTPTAFESRTQLQKVLADEILDDSGIATEYGLEEATLNGISVTETEEGYRLTPTGSDPKLTFTVTVAEAERLYFNAFYDNTNVLRQPINEKFSVSSPQLSYPSYPTQKRNGLLDLGEYENREVRVTVKVKSEVTVKEIGLVGIKTERLQSSVEKAETLGLTAGKNSVSGSYTAKGGECVFLSVPYDEGLTLKINGKEANLYTVYEGFCAFYLREGENEIEISFRPKGFSFGLVASVAGICAAVASCVFAFVKKKKFTLGEKGSNVAYYLFLTLGSGVVLAVYVLPMILCIF